MAVTLALPGSAAQAQQCAVAPAQLAFGTLSAVSGRAYTANASLSVSCHGYPPASVVRACISLGAGSGGAGYAPRTLAGSAGNLAYDIYADPAYGVSVGGRGGSGMPLQFDIPMLDGAGDSGSGARTITLYGRALPDPASVAAGTYSSLFAGADARLDYAPLGAAAAARCDISAGPGTPLTLQVSASVVNDCSINAGNIDLGRAGLLSQRLEAHGTVQLACTRGAAFTIALDAGRGAGATPLERAMTQVGGSALIHYRIYMDAARTQPWGDGTGGSTTVGGVGNGALQNFTAYTSVAPQATPAAGLYIDTVTATVSY